MRIAVLIFYLGNLNVDIIRNNNINIFYDLKIALIISPILRPANCVLRPVAGRWGPTQHCHPQRHHACTFFDVQFGSSEHVRTGFSHFRRKTP